MTQRITYAEFGHNFIQHVVTARRLGDTIEAVLDKTIAGSVNKLPASLMVADYVFRLQDIRADPVMDRLPDIGFDLHVIGEIQLDVMLLGVELKFTLAVDICVHIDVETWAPVVLKLIPQPVTSKNIKLTLEGENLPGEIVENLMVVKPVVRDQIVREVNLRINDPEMQALATIDVLHLVDQVEIGGASAATTPTDATTAPADA